MGSSGVDAELLKSRYRLTKQRAAILAALDDGAHVTAETLLERVRRQMPGVSLGTIYRTVDILCEIGLVQIFEHQGLAARYEASLSKHHHLVCDRCHDIVNIHIPALGPLIDAVATLHRYATVDASLTLRGRCADCAQAAGAIPATVPDAGRGEPRAVADKPA
jgi:Fe2+ or Zn2+ uptake regulation protein